VQGIAVIAAAFYPKPVIVRTSDFKVSRADALKISFAAALSSVLPSAHVNMPKTNEGGL
jgi:phosphoenolpyruvate synthase/pyruvate phosphate dikinase